VDEIVLMAVLHSLYDLPEKYLGGAFIESSLLFDILQQLSSLQELHDDGYFHVLECEAVVHFDYVIMVE
jgi:hypothetical protein